MVTSNSYIGMIKILVAYDLGLDIKVKDPGTEDKWLDFPSNWIVPHDFGRRIYMCEDFTDEHWKLWLQKQNENVNKQDEIVEKSFSNNLDYNIHNIQCILAKKYEPHTQVIITKDYSKII